MHIHVTSLHGTKLHGKISWMAYYGQAVKEIVSLIRTSSLETNGHGKTQREAETKTLIKTVRLNKMPHGQRQSSSLSKQTT